MVIEVKTEHPHIVKVKGVRGGQPVIKNTGLEVAFIVKLHKMGETVDDMVALYPNLVLAAVHDALSYYYDHREEIDREIASQELPAVLERNGLTVDHHGRIIRLDR